MLYLVVVILPKVLQARKIGLPYHLRVDFSVRQCSYMFYSKTCKILKCSSEMCSQILSAAFYAIMWVSC